MKRYFLIDTENVGQTFLPGIQELTAQDTLILFHYEKAAPFKQEMLLSIARAKCKHEIIEMRIHTKNAMDFQICSYLGVLVNKNMGNAEYYIVSRDKGYTAAVEFIRQSYEGITVKTITTLNTKENKDSQRDKIDQILKAYPRKVRKQVTDAIKCSKSALELHNNLQNRLKTDGKDIYKILKPMFQELNHA